LQTSLGTTKLSFFSLLQSEGLFRLYRGAPAVILACIPSHAAYFSAYEFGKKTFNVSHESGHNPLGAAASGSLATMVHDAVLTPMDVVKQRMQLGYYKSVRDAVSTIVQNEGIFAFYRSYPTTVFMNIPFAAAAIAANDSLRRILHPMFASNNQKGSNDSTVPFFVYLLSGAGGGAFAAAITSPIDIVKTRIQTSTLFSSSITSSASSSSPPLDSRIRSQVAWLYTSANPSPLFMKRDSKKSQSQSAMSSNSRFLSTFRSIIEAEGVMGLWRGVGARIMIHAPSQAVSWVVYEYLKDALRRHRLLE
jgi:solute carrier family 25 (mitochondrial iron transporter), member 28/37